jgi:amino acid adenylation domain-containing protein
MVTPDMATAGADGTLPDQVLSRFRSGDDRRALTVEGCSYSYASLGRMARRLAGELEGGLEGGCGTLTGQRIVVAAAGSLTAYLAVLASFELDATYVPVDPTAPADRLDDILRRVDPAVVVVDPRHRERVPVLAAHAPTYDAMTGTWHGSAGERVAQVPTLSNHRYVLFTSGSTGKPKGIGIRDACIAAMFDAMSGIAPIRPDDRVAQAFDLTFDLAQYSTLASWIAGAEVVVLSPGDRLQPTEFIRRHRISYWFSVPSVAGFAEDSGDLTVASIPTVRTSLFCGEALPTALALSWRDATVGAPLWNLYGPTEATIACAAHRLSDTDDAAEGFVSLGYAFPGTVLAVLAADGSVDPLKPGAVGELLIGGAQLFDGYLGDDATTKAAFVCDGVERWYRSGDRVRVDDDALRFLGRADEQVQVRGHRVELREVEMRIAQALDTEPSRVVAVPLLGRHGTVDHLGVAVALPDVAADRIRQVVVDCLPPYMVPRVVSRCDQFPLNANGKIDRPAIRVALTQE